MLGGLKYLSQEIVFIINQIFIDSIVTRKSIKFVLGHDQATNEDEEVETT